MDLYFLCFRQLFRNRNMHILSIHSCLLIKRLFTRSKLKEIKTYFNYKLNLFKLRFCKVKSEETTFQENHQTVLKHRIGVITTKKEEEEKKSKTTRQTRPREREKGKRKYSSHDNVERIRERKKWWKEEEEEVEIDAWAP